MAWFKKSKAPISAQAEAKKVQMPEGLWTKCKNCEEIIYSKEIERNLNVCPKCDYHFRISARDRISLVIDEGTFVQTDPDMTSLDFLKFKDSKKYSDRIKAALKKSGGGDAVITGSGLMNGQEVVVAVFDFGFLGGSMGSVVGEKITRAIELGLERNAPVMVFSSSGGARMQESLFSLMQMAKTSSAVAAVARARPAGGCLPGRGRGGTLRRPRARGRGEAAGPVAGGDCCLAGGADHPARRRRLSVEADRNPLHPPAPGARSGPTFSQDSGSHRARRGPDYRNQRAP